jgi:hypothetical protein
MRKEAPDTNLSRAERRRGLLNPWGAVRSHETYFHRSGKATRDLANVLELDRGLARPTTG